MTPQPDSKKVVLHYTAGAFLHLTETYIHSQICHQRTWEPVVYCQRIELAEKFPVPLVRTMGVPGEASAGPRLLIKAWNRLIGNHQSILRWMKEDSPSVIHAHHGFSGYKLIPIIEETKLPMVVSFYGSDATKMVQLDPRWKTRYPRMFAAGSAFLVEGHTMKRCIESLGCPPEKAIVHHLGVDVKKIPFAIRKPDADGTVRVLVSASFKEKKGIPLAVEAYGRLRKIQPELKLALTIIGDALPLSDETQEKGRIMEALKKFNLLEETRLLGYQTHEQFLKETARHHLFIQPSFTPANGDTEGGSPVSVTEAAASGMVLLSTTHCDIPEVVLDKRTGYLVPERDVDALTERLAHLVKNPAEWPAFSQAARRHVEKEYDVATQARKLEALYDRLAQTR